MLWSVRRGLSDSENCYYLLVSTTCPLEIFHWSAKIGQLQIATDLQYYCSFLFGFVGKGMSLSCRDDECSFISAFLLSVCLSVCLNLAAYIIRFGWGFFVLWFGRRVMWKSPQGLSYPNWRAECCSEREVNSAVTQVCFTEPFSYSLAGTRWSFCTLLGCSLSRLRCWKHKIRYGFSADALQSLQQSLRWLFYSSCQKCSGNV